MKVKDVVNRVKFRYNDETYNRASQGTYLQFLDDALVQLVLSRPDSHVKTDIVSLVAGTRQDLPVDGYQLIDIYMNKNMGSAAWVDGAPIFQVKRENLDYFSDWHNSTPSWEVEEFSYDPNTPKTFWVSPPVPSESVEGQDANVLMAYSYGFISLYDLYDSETNTFEEIMEMDLDIDAKFREPLVMYMLYLLYTTDSGSLNDMQIAQRYEQSFYQALGIEYKASILVAPKVPETQEDPVNG